MTLRLKDEDEARHWLAHGATAPMSGNSDVENAAFNGYLAGLTRERSENAGKVNTIRNVEASLVLKYLDNLLDDAAVHIFPDDLEKCSRSECAVTVFSVRVGGEHGSHSVPLFSRAQVMEGLAHEANTAQKLDATLVANQPDQPAADESTVEGAWNLIERLIVASGRRNALHAEYQGKAMSDEIYEEFATLRDQTIPELARAIKGALSATSAGIKEWFDVSVRMPDHRIRVIAAHYEHTLGDCFFGSAGVMIGHCGIPGYQEERGIECWRYTNDGNAVPPHLQPTQWMELPTPSTSGRDGQASATKL